MNEPEASFAESLHGDELELDPVEVDESVVIDAPVEPDEEEVEVDRDGAEAAYQTALTERNAQLTLCLTVQNKLADYFKRKKTDAEKASQAPKLNAEEMDELEMTYHERIRAVDIANDELMAQKAEYKTSIDELNERKVTRQSGVSDEWEALLTRKREVVKKCVFSRSGAKISSKEMDQMEELERRKNDELARARLDFIKLKNRKEAREQALQQREQLGEGLHMIDYEQLKIENQTYNEKVEERNEDLLKFNAKINSTVQILTHLKEKLHFVLNQNDKLNEQLTETEKVSNAARDKLTRVKTARGRVQRDNSQLQGSMGLLGKMELLYDFEDKIGASDELGPKLTQLKQRYAAIGKENKMIKKKMASINAE